MTDQPPQNDIQFDEKCKLQLNSQHALCWLSLINTHIRGLFPVPDSNIRDIERENEKMKELVTNLKKACCQFMADDYDKNDVGGLYGEQYEDFLSGAIHEIKSN